VALGARLGGDFNVARRLYHLVREAGFAAPEITHHQPVLVRGELKRLEELSFREVGPRLLGAGLLPAEELEALLGSVRLLTADEEVVYALSRMVQVWACA